MYIAKSRECLGCGKLILPKPKKNMEVPSICPNCNHDSRKTIARQEKRDDLKRSSTIQRLESLLNEAFKKYYEHADFREKDDYTENYIHRRNHEIYLSETIIQDAAEIVSCIDSMINFDKFPSSYFTNGRKTHNDLFEEVIDNETILKLKPYYTLLVTASSVVKARQNQIEAHLRYPRTGATSIITTDQKQK